MERLPTRTFTPMDQARLERERLETLERLLYTTPGMERWRDNPHMLPVRVRKAVERREVRPLCRITERLPGQAEVYVIRLKPRPPRWRKPLILAGIAFAVAGLTLWVGYLLFQVLAVALAPALVILAVVWIIFHLATEHDARCKGLHCTGCRWS